MKYFLYFLGLSLTLTVISVVGISQIPQHQRLALPAMEFSLSKENPTFSVQAYCIDGDIVVARPPSRLYNKVLSPQRNGTVRVGKSNVISWQEAINRRIIRITLLNNLYLVIESLTPTGLDISITQNVVIGTEHITHGLSIGAIPKAIDEEQYKLIQGEIWKQRFLQKKGLKQEPVDGNPQSNIDALKALKHQLGLNPETGEKDEIVNFAIRNWEQLSRRNLFVPLLGQIYSKTANDFPDFFSLLFRFFDDAKFSLKNLNNADGLDALSFLQDFDKIKNSLKGDRTDFAPEKLNGTWQLIYKKEWLELSEGTDGIAFKVTKRQPLTLQKIEEIQIAKVQYLKEHCGDANYNYMYLKSINGDNVPFYCNGQEYELSLTGVNRSQDFFHLIKEAVGINWKYDVPTIIVGDVLQNSNARTNKIILDGSIVSWINPRGFNKGSIDEYSTDKVRYIYDISAFSRLSPENTLLRQSFLDFQELPKSYLNYGVVDLRTLGSKSQAVFRTNSGLIQVWDFPQTLNMLDTRNAVKEYFQGRLTIEELEGRTKSYVDFLENTIVKIGIRKIITVEHWELDIAQLWALHNKDVSIKWYRDNPHYNLSIRNISNSFYPEVSNSCILIGRSIETTSRLAFDSLARIGLKIIYNDSLSAFLNCIKDPSISQIFWVTPIAEAGYKFSDGNLSYESLENLLSELSYPKDYIHIITSGSDSMMVKFASSGKFYRVFFTGYEPDNLRSYEDALSVVSAFFRSFSGAEYFFPTQYFDFFPWEKENYIRILKSNFLRLPDGRFRVRLDKISPIQRKRLRELSLYNEIRDGAVFPQNGNLPANTKIDDLFDQIGREKIRNFKTSKDKKNFLLGIPRLKVWMNYNYPLRNC